MSANVIDMNTRREEINRLRQEDILWEMLNYVEDIQITLQEFGINNHRIACDIGGIISCCRKMRSPQKPLATVIDE